MRSTLSALIAAAAAIALAAPAAEAHKSSRKHRHTTDGTIYYGTPGPYGSPGYGTSYRNVPYDARAHSVDPAKDYKDYPNWARWALSPKSDGARN